MKKSEKFPLLYNSNVVYPKNGKCPVCKKKMDGNFIILHAGAMLMDRKNDTGTMSDDLDGFLNLTWHGDFKGVEILTRLELAEDVHNGQCEFYFCSPECLKEFFNDCVDILVQKMEKDSKRKISSYK